MRGSQWLEEQYQDEHEPMRHNRRMDPRDDTNCPKQWRLVWDEDARDYVPAS